VHDVRVINPLCHFFQQPVVPDIVKVGSQVKPDLNSALEKVE
jgi:hypothetical protein